MANQIIPLAPIIVQAKSMGRDSRTLAGASGERVLHFGRGL